MKNKIICVTMVVGMAVSTTNLSPKHIIPSLDRLKSKVEGALKGPKTSLKEFFEKAKSTGSKIFINGRPAESLNAEAERKSFETEISEIETIFNNLYWSKQESFAKELKQSEDKLNLLKDKFKEKYTAVKSPLIAFAKDLALESEALTTVKDRVEKAIPHVKKFNDLEAKYLELSQAAIKLSETLNEIVQTTDSL